MSTFLKNKCVRWSRSVSSLISSRTKPVKILNPTALWRDMDRGKYGPSELFIGFKLKFNGSQILSNKNASNWSSVYYSWSSNGVSKN